MTAEDSGIAELTEQISQLVNAVRVPDVVLAGLQASQNRQKWYSLGLAISLAIDLTLSVVLAFGLIALSHLQETQTSVSCNLYGFIIPSLKNPQPESIDTPDKRKAFVAFTEVILSDYGRLGCKP